MRWHLEVHNLIFKEKFLIVVCWVNGSSDQRLFIENIIDILEESLRGAFELLALSRMKTALFWHNQRKMTQIGCCGFLEIGLNICDKSYGIIRCVCLWRKNGLEAADKAIHAFKCRHLEVEGKLHAVTMYMPNNSSLGFYGERLIVGIMWQNWQQIRCRRV